MIDTEGVLVLTIPDGPEYFDEESQTFIPGIKGGVLHLKHSLISLKKWEAKYKRFFIDDGPKEVSEVLYYIKCMSLDKSVREDLYTIITEANYKEVMDYISDPMTATKVNMRSKQKPGQKELMTAELFYYYMCKFQIPWEAEKWHLNQLQMLINVFSVKDGKQEKMSKADVYARNRQLNEARKAKYNTKG